MVRVAKAHIKPSHIMSIGPKVPQSARLTSVRVCGCNSDKMIAHVRGER
jgi:hypothetical protein